MKGLTPDQVRSLHEWMLALNFHVEQVWLDWIGQVDEINEGQMNPLSIPVGATHGACIETSEGAVTWLALVGGEWVSLV